MHRDLVPRHFLVTHLLPIYLLGESITTLYVKNLKVFPTRQNETRISGFFHILPPLFIIKEVQIQITMTCQLTPVRMVIVSKATNNKFCGGCGERGPSALSVRM